MCVGDDGMKTEYKIILLTIIIATVTSVIFFNRINDIAKPDEFDKEIAQYTGTEPEPNIEQSMVYLLTFIFFISIMSIGLINCYLYKRRQKQIANGLMEDKKIQQLKTDGMFLIVVILAVSIVIVYVAYANLDESGTSWYDREKDAMVSEPPPSFQELLPIILPILIIDILFVLLIYWITLKRIEKHKNKD
jgi:hypothetical protein